MKRYSRSLPALAALFVISLVFFCAACAPSATITIVSSPEPTVLTTLEPTATPTTSPSGKPTPAMDEYGFTDERKAELNQQFQDFLNKEGEFTPDKVSSIAFAMSSAAGDNLQLGLADGASKIGCVFFDYIEKDDNLFLLMGFDGKDGNRFVTPVQIPIYFLKNSEKYHFWFSKHYEDIFYDEGFADISSENISDLYKQLDNLKEKYMVISLPLSDFSGSESDYDGVKRIYFKEHNSKVGLSKKMVSIMANNGFDIYPNIGEIDDSYSIPQITNINDFNSIDLSTIPLLDPIIYISSNN